MPSWKDEYHSSLKDVELSNPVNMELVQTCSSQTHPHQNPSLRCDLRSQAHSLRLTDGRSDISPRG
jgi:hypothetical protein